MSAILVALGGAIGAVLRDRANHWQGPIAGTDLVNRLGAVLLGVVGVLVRDGVLHAPALTLLGVGVAGGMTTFSTFLVQVVDPAVSGPDNPAWWRLGRESLVGLALAASAVVVTGWLTT